MSGNPKKKHKGTKEKEKESSSIAAKDDDKDDNIINQNQRNSDYLKTDVYLVPKAPKLPKTFEEKETTRRLIVVLEKATLETYLVPKSRPPQYQLINCDEHQKTLRKLGKLDATTYRPDITHQCLMALLDSPLNKAGLMQIYIHTANKVLIEVNPQVRIPRTYRRFSGLMVQLLHKLSIHSVDGNEKLLRVIKNPITNYLPTKCVKLNHSICIVIGAMSHGTDNFADDWIDEKIGISQYPLSAAVACSKFCCELESLWGIW
ncbi:8723_t:CDS:2 [Entrophospora sp. SA101]|nr:7561_t:CDS:2 [Entrophospora sp. SA101]CAJ0633096.1 12601_t:CDS:2 [Entrophospora sp. SA101]CAJ0745334.1 10126_t:CDS:2 [Entrophospora sp. SA101]CAJ0766941.1 8723_t:CDS:2 [Entrophospora sp. SA101]CAJ0826633.1 2237_t:CDS:2 [Entrophospora sp. SA101]